MFEEVWGGFLGGFGHTVIYPVNPNPPRASSTHLIHLYLTQPYDTRGGGGGGGGGVEKEIRGGGLSVVWDVLGWFGVFWGGLGCFYGPQARPVEVVSCLFLS